MRIIKVMAKRSIPPIPAGWRDHGRLGKKDLVRLVARNHAPEDIDFVMKLKPLSSETYPRERFDIEVALMVRLNGTPGVIPVVDVDQAQHPAWFVMPKAEPLIEHLGPAPDLRDVVAAVAVIADTLARVADLDIAHRDIKPDNLLWLNGPQVADFGIAEVPQAPELTDDGHRLGPVEYLAPEMRQPSPTTAGKSADVWSLAKTLFMLAQRDSSRWPPVGTMTAGRPEFFLRSVGGDAADDLGYLLEAATAYEPYRRIKMRAFANELQDWLSLHPVGTARRQPPPEPSSGPHFASFDRRMFRLDHAEFLRRKDELRTRVRRMMQELAPEAVIVDQVTGWLIETHGHNEDSWDAIESAGSTTSANGIRLVLTGFLVGDTDIEYVGEVQHREPDGRYSLLATNSFYGTLELPSGLVAGNEIRDWLRPYVETEQFPWNSRFRNVEP